MMMARWILLTWLLAAGAAAAQGSTSACPFADDALHALFVS